MTKADDPIELGVAIRTVADLRGRRFAHLTSWDRTRDAYAAVFASVGRNGHRPTQPRL